MLTPQSFYIFGSPWWAYKTGTAANNISCLKIMVYDTHETWSSGRLEETIGNIFALPGDIEHFHLSSMSTFIYASLPIWMLVLWIWNECNKNWLKKKTNGTLNWTNFETLFTLAVILKLFFFMLILGSNKKLFSLYSHCCFAWFNRMFSVSHARLLFLKCHLNIPSLIH